MSIPRIYIAGKITGMPLAQTMQNFHKVETDLKKQNGQRFNTGQKFYTLTTQDRHGVLVEGYIRKLTPIECGRLQTIEDDVIIDILAAGISETQVYKMLGNGWTIDVIAHIFKNITHVELTG